MVKIEITYSQQVTDQALPGMSQAIKKIFQQLIVRFQAMLRVELRLAG